MGPTGVTTSYPDDRPRAITLINPDDPLTAVTRYFAAYNLVCGPVVDAENHLLGAVSVDDVLDHLLPDDWREREEPELSGAEGVT